MNNRISRTLCSSLGLLLVCAVATTAPADVYWDINGSTPGTGTAPSGTWDLTAANWTTAALGDIATTTWTDGQKAIFTAGTLGVDATSAYTVSVVGSLSPSGIVNAMSGALTISGGTLSLGADGIVATADSGDSTISSSLTVAANQTWSNNGSGLLNITGATVINNTLTLTGSGTIQLSAANSGFGTVNVAGGTVQIGNNAAFGFGQLNLLGGTVTTSAGGSGGDRTISNDLTINGSVAFGNTTFTGFSLTFNGANMLVAADSVISNSNNNGLTFAVNPLVLAGNLTVNAGATPAAVAFSGGITVSGASGANRSLVLNNASASVTLAGPLSGTDVNQTLTLAGSGTNNIVGNITTGSLAPLLVIDSTTGGTFIFNTANSFAGGVTTRNGTVVVAQSSSGGNGPVGSGTLTLSGGTIRADSIADRTLTNDLAITGPFTTTFIQSTASGRKLTFTPISAAAISGGPTLLFNGAGGPGVQFNSGQSVTSGVLSIVQNNSAPVVFAGGMSVLAGGGLSIAQNSSGAITVQNSLSLAEDMAVAMNGLGNVTLNFTSGLTINGDRTITVTGSGSGTLEFTGPGTFSADAPNRTLTIDTSYAPAGLPGINIGSLQQTANNPALVINGPGRVRFNGASGTFAGGTTFTGGPTILVLNSSNTPLTQGPFGVGKITVGTGTKIQTGDTTARSLDNDVDFLGDVTLGAASGAANITWKGNVTVASAAPVWTLAGNTMIFGTFPSTGSLTIAPSVTTGWQLTGPGNIEINNGFNFSSNVKLIADSTGNVFIRGTLNGGSNTLTLSGSHPGIWFGRDVSGNNNDYRVRGTTGGVVIDGGNVIMGGTQRNASNSVIASSDFTGGVTLLNGKLLIANTGSFVSSGALSSSPIGLGTLTLTGGTIAVSGTTARTLNNSLAINGDAVFGEVGSVALTIDPTVITSPAQGTISISGNRTLRFLSDVTLGGTGTGFAGITGGANVTKFGPGRLTLINSTANNNTAVWTLGDNNLATASTSAGGVLQVNSQTALGSGAVVVNFGGTLTPNGNFSLSNAISFAAGATFNPTSATGGIQLAQSNPVSFASGAVLNNTSGQTLTLHGVNLTLPTEGVFVNNSTGNGSTSVTTSWPSLTGDMFFAGTGSHVLNTRSVGTNPAMVLSSVDGEARTIVFSMSTGRTVLNNVRLNADLTLDGGGSPMVGSGGNEAGGLGSVTTDPGDSYTIVKRGPNAVAIATGSTFSGALIVKEGAIQINNTNSTTAIFPNASITLDGGAIRVFDNTNNSTNFTSNIAVTAASGGWEAYSTGNSGNINYSGTFSGTGQISLRYGGLAANSLNNTGGFVISGNNSGFEGGFVVSTANARGSGAVFANADATGSAQNTILVRKGAMVSFNFDPLAAGVMSKFSFEEGGLLALNNFGSGTLTMPAGAYLAGRNNTTFNTAGLAITPHDNTYRISPGNGITFDVANVFTGANDLVVAAILPDALTPNLFQAHNMNPWIFTKSQNYSGTTTIRGTFVPQRQTYLGATLRIGVDADLTGTTSLSVVDGGVLEMNANPVGGGTLAALTSAVLDSGATVNVNSPNQGNNFSALQTLAVRGASTFRVGDATASNNDGIANRLANTAAVTLGGSTGGGTLNLAHPSSSNTHQQTIASLAVDRGANTIGFVNTAAGTATLTITNPTISNNNGGWLNIRMGTATASGTTTSGSDVVTFSGGVPSNLMVGQKISGTGIQSADPQSTIVTEILTATTVRISQNATATGTNTLTFVGDNGQVVLGGAPTLDAGGLIGGWATFQLAGVGPNPGDFVTVDGSNRLVPVGYTGATATYTTQDNSTFNPAGFTAATNLNINNTSVTFNQTINSSTTINSLRTFAYSGFRPITLAIASGATLTIGSGGVIAGAYTGSNTGQGSITINGPGTLSSGTSDMYLFAPTANGNNPLAINAPLDVNGGSGKLFIGPTGSGAVRLGSAANAYAALELVGKVEINALGALPQNIPVRIFGGNLSILHNGGTYNNSIYVAPQGGQIVYTNNTGSTTLAGPITLDGSVGVHGGNGPGQGTIFITGDISGRGAIGFGHGGSTGSKHVVVLSGNNSNWTGGLRVDNDAAIGWGNGGSGTRHVRLVGAASAGTGPIIASSSQFNSLTFDPQTSDQTWSNSFVFAAATTPIVFWGTGPGLSASGGGTGIVRLAGDFEGASQALVLQGYATADDQVGELVLSGRNNLAGAATGFPAISSYGTLVAPKNFVNGNNGITLGTTDRSGTAQQNANLVLDLPSGSSTTGALGFVRFATQQAMGFAAPAYYSAIRQAGTGGDGRFGYLLTGTAGGNTFEAPTGKSFVIGSLGAGTQVAGTFGVASDQPGAESALLRNTTINVHADAPSDNQALKMLARAADDTLILGEAGSPVIFTPTTGDSGFATVMTPLSHRSGQTLVEKVGAGTVKIVNVDYRTVSGGDASASFSWTVTGGTLLANNTSGSATGGGPVTVASGATLGGLGSIAGAVAVNAGGTLDAGDGATPGTLTINNTLSFASTASAVFDIASDTSYDKVAGLTGLTYGGSLTVQAIGSPTWAAGQVYDLFNWTSGTPTGTFSTITLPTLPGSLAWKDYGGGTYFDYATGQIEIISAGATPRVWNGGSPANDFWTSGSNWVGGNAPVSGDQVIFAGNVRLTPDNDNIGLVVGGLKFSGAGDPEGNAGAFTLGGNALTVAGKIDNQSTNAQTINHGITLAAAVNPADTGVVNVAAGAGTLTLAGNVGGTVGLVKTGSGTAALTASSNAYTGDTYVKAGTLQVDAGVNSNGTWADDTTVGLNAGDGGPSPSLVTLITEHVRQDTLKINDNGKVVITGTSGPSSTSVVNLLLIGDGSGGFLAGLAAPAVVESFGASAGPAVGGPGTDPSAMFEDGSFGGLGGGGAVVPVGGEVGGASPVPEPATWALAAMALLALGYAARRRK